MRQTALSTALFVACLVPALANAQGLHTLNYVNFPAPTYPYANYVCQNTNGVPCRGSVQAPGTNWYVNYYSSSRASYGVLYGYADAYLTGNDSLGSLDGGGPFPSLASTGGRGGFSDTVTVGGGTGSGTLRFTFTVTGTQSHTSGQYARPQFQYIPIVNGVFRWDLQQNFLIDSTGHATVPIPITFNSPSPFDVEFYALAQINNWVAGAAAHAEYTAVLSSVTVTNSAGQVVPLSIASQSHAVYSSTGIAPGFLPPAWTPGFSCFGKNCLGSWATLARPNGAPLVTFVGNASNGSTGPSSVDGVGGANAQGTAWPGCNVYENPASSWWWTSNPPTCGYGFATGSGLGYAAFGVMKAYAGMYGLGLPSSSTANMYGGAVDSDTLFASYVPGTDSLPPPKITTDINNNRVARFTFTVTGSTWADSGTAAREGFFFRGGGGPCPSLNCTWVLQPWLGPYAPGRTVSVDLPFDYRYPLSATFLFVAGVTQTGNGRSVANFANTAVLTGIQLFQGTLDNIGPEITDFRLISASGAQYNRHGAVMNVGIDVNPRSLNASNAGTMKVSILPSDGFNPANDVDPSSLTFGAFGTEQSLAFCDPVPSAGDRASSTTQTLSCHFNVGTTRLSGVATTGVLQGRLKDGTYFQGTRQLTVH